MGAEVHGDEDDLLKSRFAIDSPVEGGGFEPSVPRKRIDAFRDGLVRPMAGYDLPDEHHAR
jgi:hypothetical protein